MTPHDFAKLVQGERPREGLRSVSGDAILASATAAGKAPSIAELLAAKRGAPQRKVVYSHVLGPPATPEDLRVAEHRLGVSLPSDLRELLETFDGVHLWADESGRAYKGLAPVCEWRPARQLMFGPTADESLLADRYLALSYHRDGAAFVVLDTSAGRYFLMDSAGPDESSPIGDNAPALLDWLWKSRAAPLGTTTVERN